MRTGSHPDLAAGILQPFHVTVPRHTEVLPFGSDRPESLPVFPIRGIKGWAWSPEQYRAEIPVMARYRLNFLMNDYGSLWELGPHGTWATDRNMNFWYRPLPLETRVAFEKIIHECQQQGITFCFSINPNLKSDKTFDYDNKEDLEALWQHYAWSQGLGVKWFNVSLDDISHRIDAQGQARLVNEIFRRLRAHDSRAQLTFCPTWYAGTGQSGTETNTTLGAGDTPGARYTRTLAKQLHPEVYLFWTGPDVCSLTISATDAKHYKALCGHRILLWDNYPVNDQHPALHLGPLTGRSIDLSSTVDGYISNSMSYQDEANRIPLLTIADYLWDPPQYDPNRSIGQAIAHLGESQSKRDALRHLVELYPGRLWDQSKQTGWNSLRERFDQRLRLDEWSEAHELTNRARNTLDRMNAIFSDPWSSGSGVLDQDLAAMVRQMSSR
jgi:hypothetical protein